MSVGRVLCLKNLILTHLFVTISYLPEGANPIMNHLTAVLYRRPTTLCSIKCTLGTLHSRSTYTHSESAVLS